jgi:hypothetical protein
MKTILFLLLIYSSSSLADVLFIDLNNVEMEIKVARDAAKLRGENLIVLPSNREKYIDEKRNKLNRDYMAIESRYESACGDIETPKCSRLIDDLNKIRQKLEDLPGPAEYNSEELKKEMQLVKGNISSIMISGHDGGGDFYGEMGNIRGESFLDILKNFKGNKDVRSLYLLGCNSATTHTLGSIWKAALPNANFIAGYEHTGYLRDNGMGHSFIKKVMAEEKNIIASATMNDALKKFRNISPKAADHGTAACVVLPAVSKEPIYLSSTKNAGELGEILGCSKDANERINKFLTCALSEEAPCDISTEARVIQKMLSNTACNFNFKNEIDDISKVKNKIYTLAALFTEYHSLSLSSIFSNVPSKTLKDLGIDWQTLKNYPDIKKALLKVRDSYDLKFEYDMLKDMPMKELQNKSDLKNFLDENWLIVSNLDLSKPRTNSNGGIVRAQAFHKALQAGKVTEDYNGRIQALEKELEATVKSDYLSKGNLKREIELLKTYQKENPK